MIFFFLPHKFRLNFFYKPHTIIECVRLICIRENRCKIHCASHTHVFSNYANSVVKGRQKSLTESQQLSEQASSQPANNSNECCVCLYTNICSPLIHIVFHLHGMWCRWAPFVFSYSLAWIAIFKRKSIATIQTVHAIRLIDRVLFGIVQTIRNKSHKTTYNIHQIFRKARSSR